MGQYRCAPNGTTFETKDRAANSFRESARSVFNVCVSLGIGYSGKELTSNRSIVLSYFVYIVSVLLVINSVWGLLDSFTTYAETRSAALSEQAAWLLAEKELYESAKILVTSDDKKRRVCTVCSDRKEGEKKPVFLFVHGSMARMGQYASLMKLADDAGYNYVSYDFYGMGRSPKPTEKPWCYTTEMHLNDLISVYRHTTVLFPSQPVIVVGHSYGCSLVLRLSMLLNNPMLDRVDLAALPPPSALVLLGAYRWDASSSRSKTMVRFFSLPLWLLRVIRPWLSAGFKTRAFAPETLMDKELQSVINYAEALSGANAFHVVQPFYVDSGKQTLHALSLAKVCFPPTFFVTGESDKLAVPEEASKLSKLIGSSSKGVSVIQRAGHQVMEERPAQVFAVLKEAVAAVAIPGFRDEN